MKTRQLGNSDLNITRIGFGAWAIGGGDWQFGWGHQDDADSVAAIHRALELGINWIDTAAVYGLGHSEEVVATALAEWRGPRPYVFTKCVRVWNEKREITTSLKAESIRKECENSLRRLRVDVIDLYQIHWPAGDPAETEEGWTEMANLQRQGKVRWIGVSNFNVEQLRLVQAIAPVTSLQPPYSLIRRDIEREILPYCRQNGIGVIVYSPMGSGLLTGAMTRERAAGASRLRLAEPQPGVQGAPTVAESRSHGPTECRGQTPWVYSGRGRHCVDAPAPRCCRCHRRCAESETG